MESKTAVTTVLLLLGPSLYVFKLAAIADVPDKVYVPVECLGSPSTRSTPGVTYGSVEVQMTGGWKENTGWELTCSWTVDSRPLQSVRLYMDDVQFLIYRPEKQGSKQRFEIHRNDTRIIVDCHDFGRTGKCGMTLELLAAPVFATKFKCEVSEEGPRFDMKQTDYVVEVFVPPSYPHMELSTAESLTNVNCSSAGIPAPRLVWRIGETRIPENFSNRRWNWHTKLWHSWSVVSIPQPQESLVLTCGVLSMKSGNAVEDHSIEVTINSSDSVTKAKVILMALSWMVALLQ